MWKDIEGYEGMYQVSDTGEIKSLERYVETYRYGKKRLQHVEERILKPFITKSGYSQVTLRKDDQREVLYVHRLVANNFLAISFGEVVNHIDGNKQNNNATNLELTTYSENNQHAYDTGLRKRYEQKPVFLPKETIKEIKECGKYASYAKMAEDYGIRSPDVISNILNNRTYQDIN